MCAFQGHYEARNLDIENFMNRYPQVLPEVAPAGDFMSYVYDRDKNNNDEFIGEFKIYWSIRRARGSRSASLMSFMTMQWAPFGVPNYTIHQTKIDDNYTSLLDLPYTPVNTTFKLFN